jgi:hypothetical protein
MPKRAAPKQRGAKETYKPEYVEQVKRLAALGLIESEIATFFGRAHKTIKNWRLAHPDFDEAMRVGKEIADERVVLRLYERAVGFYYEAEKVMMVDGKPQVVKYQEYLPPDTTAIIFWSKNRMPEEWRERRDASELPPPQEEEALEFNRDLARRVAFLLRDRSGDTQH